MPGGAADGGEGVGALVGCELHAVLFAEDDGEN